VATFKPVDPALVPTRKLNPTNNGIRLFLHKVGEWFPEAYIGRNVEIILFAVDEATQGMKKSVKRTFDAVKLDLTNYKFDRDEANQR
jgi:hypothetical protein